MPNPPLNPEEEKELEHLRSIGLKFDDERQPRLMELLAKKLGHLEEQVELDALKESNDFEALKEELDSLEEHFFFILNKENKPGLTIDDKISEIKIHIKRWIELLKSSKLKKEYIEILSTQLISACFTFFSVVIDKYIQQQSQENSKNIAQKIQDLKLKIVDLSNEIYLYFIDVFIQLTEENREQLIDQIIGFYIGSADITYYLFVAIGIKDKLTSFQIPDNNCTAHMLMGLSRKLKLQFEDALVDRFIVLVRLCDTTSGAITLSIFQTLYELSKTPKLLREFLDKITKLSNVKDIEKYLQEFNLVYSTLRVDVNKTIQVVIDGEYIDFPMNFHGSFFDIDKDCLQSFIAVIKEIDAQKNISFEKKYSLIQYLLKKIIFASENNNHDLYPEIARCRSALLAVNILVHMLKYYAAYADIPEIRRLQAVVRSSQLENLSASESKEIESIARKLSGIIALQHVDVFDFCCLDDPVNLRRSVVESFLTSVFLPQHHDNTPAVVARYDQLICDISNLTKVDKKDDKGFENIYKRFSILFSRHARELLYTVTNCGNLSAECMISFKTTQKVFIFLTKLFNHVNHLQGLDQSLIKSLNDIMENLFKDIKNDEIRYAPATQRLFDSLEKWLNQLPKTSRYVPNWFQGIAIASEEFKSGVIAEIAELKKFFPAFITAPLISRMPR